MFLLGLYGIGIVGNIAFGNGVGEYPLLLLRVVEAESGAYVEAFEGVDVDICVAENSPVGVAVVFVALKASYGILAVGIAANRSGILAVGGVDGQRGVGLKYIFKEAAGSCSLVGAVYGEVLAYGDNVAKGLELGVHAGREALEV